MKKTTKFATLLALCAVSACSMAGPRARGFYQSHASYDRIFNAAVASVPAIGYHTTSINKSDGLITAEQNVIMGRGSASALTATLARQRNVSLLTVNLVAPPGTFAMGGDFHENVDEYIQAIRASVPDLHEAAQ